MTDTLSPLLNAIEAHESAANRLGDLSDERVQALNEYLGKPYGNEVEGRSQVVSRDVADTIEWIKPSMMRIFASGDEIVSFDPRGPEDVEGAQQESDYTNYILTQKNNWFRVFYVWCTDALMQKNAYVKAWWEDKTDVTVEKYQGLSEDQVAIIMQDHEIEITKNEVYPDPTFQGYPPEIQMQAQQSGQPLPPPPQFHDIECKRTSSYGCVKYKEIAPERCVVDQWASSIDLEDVGFFEHFEFQTRSDIKEAKLELPVDAGDETGDGILETEEEARNLYGEPWTDAETNDPASKRYKVRECWIKFDEDGDGIAELRHVIVVGKHILLNETAEFIPVSAITPKMMPHRHVGRSIRDEVEDLQRIKTALLRGTLDNMYLGLNGRYGVSGKVNLDDMLTSRPGGIVRVDTQAGDIGGHILPFAHPNMMANGIEAIEYIDQIKQNRTGVTAYVTSVDENVLNKTASGTNMLQNAAMAKIELIARVFAETGVKRLMWLIHAISLGHARKPEVVRLRNKWVTVDPRQWKNRMDMTVSVGLGTGNRDQQLVHLGNIIAIQKDAFQLGLVDLKNIHHALTKYTQAAGFKDEESFWKAPQEGQQPPKPPNPVEIEQMKQQAESQRTQFAEVEETKRTEMQIQSNERIKLAELQHKAHEVQFQANHAEKVKGAELHHDAQKTKETLGHDAQKTSATIGAKHQERQMAANDKKQLQDVTQTAQLFQQIATNLQDGQKAIADALVKVADIASSDKELYVDPKTGAKRSRLARK